MISFAGNNSETHQLTMIECVEKFEEKGPIILPTGEHQVNQVNQVNR